MSASNPIAILAIVVEQQLPSTHFPIQLCRRDISTLTTWLSEDLTLLHQGFLRIAMLILVNILITTRAIFYGNFNKELGIFKIVLVLLRNVGLQNVLCTLRLLGQTIVVLLVL